MQATANVSARSSSEGRRHPAEGAPSPESCGWGQLALELGNQAGERRVACVVLPELACELARWAKMKSEQLQIPAQARSRSKQGNPGQTAVVAPKPRPMGVVLMDGLEQDPPLGELNRMLLPNSRLSAVNVFARRMGIVEGQTIVEARCLHAALEVIALPRRRIAETLGKIAESLLDRAAIVSVESPDTIWLEVGPVMRNLGGQAAIAREVIERVRCLGHTARLAVAKGPRLAQLFARWAAQGHPEGLLVPQAREAEFARDLPLAALSLDRDQLGFLGRLGLVKLGDLQRLAEGELVQRLGADARQWIALARGEDNEPLCPIQPERVLRERLEWEEPVEGLERLRFALRRLTTNLESRLSARGEAAEHLNVIFHYDHGIARHFGVSAVTQLNLELARPLWYADELERIIVARCERTQLLAPTVALELRVIAPSPKVPKQLELGRLLAGYGATAPAEEGLPVLLAELEVDIGTERVGLLRLADSHRPEKKSLFAPLRWDEKSQPSKRQPRKPKSRQMKETDSPLPAASMQHPANCNALVQTSAGPRTLEGITRFFERPIAIDPPIRVGATVFLDHQPYVIERMRFEERLDGLEWWGKNPISRDYWRVFLRGSSGGLEGLIYVEPHHGRCFLQALVD